MSRKPFARSGFTGIEDVIEAEQMNLYFGLAVMALYGDAGAPEFSAERVNDPEILRFIQCIEASIDDLSSLADAWSEAIADGSVPELSTIAK